MSPLNPVWLPRYFSASKSTIVCQKCPAGYSSAAGSSSCPHAESGSYLDPKGSGTSLECPVGALCLGGDETPRPNSGYWVPRDEAENAGEIYVCPRSSACVGASTTRRRLLAADGEGCWTRSLYEAEDFDTKCDPDELLCAPGSRGPLCGGCEKWYTYSSALSRCTACESTDNTTPLSISGAIFGVALFIALVASIAKQKKADDDDVSFRAKTQRACTRIWEDIDKATRMVRKHVMQSDLKVAWNTYQIISTISWSLSVVFPEPFSKLLYALNFLQLDFLSLDCVTGESSYFERVILTSLAPCCVVAVNFASLAFRLRGLNKPEDEFEAKRVLAKHIWFSLLISYLVSFNSSPFESPLSFCLVLE